MFFIRKPSRTTLNQVPSNKVLGHDLAGENGILWDSSNKISTSELNRIINLSRKEIQDISKLEKRSSVDRTINGPNGPKPLDNKLREISPSCKPTQVQDYDGKDEILNPTQIRPSKNIPLRLSSKSMNSDGKYRQILSNLSKKQITVTQARPYGLPHTNEELFNTFTSFKIMQDDIKKDAQTSVFSPKRRSTRHTQLSLSISKSTKGGTLLQSSSKMMSMSFAMKNRDKILDDHYILQLNKRQGFSNACLNMRSPLYA